MLSTSPPNPPPESKRRGTSRKGPRATGTAPSILVVDDIEDNRDLYAAYFEYAGFRVDQANDGEEALAKIARRKFDVVLMDLAMPRLDGWEATRLIKSNPRTKDIVVIVVTGHLTPDDLTRARAAGADEIRAKPCMPDDMLRLVRSRLDGR
jgi:CheY-like chemotaxis protein